MSHVRIGIAGLTIALAAVSTQAQRPALATAVRQFIKVDAPVVALTHVRVIDGTGAPARADQTLVIRDGNIAALGDAARRRGARGRHGHRPHRQERDARPRDAARAPLLPDRLPASTASSARASSRLYLAGGVTTMRTGGNMNGFMDINLKQLHRGAARPPGRRSTRPRRISNGPNTVHPDARAEGCRRCAAAGGLLGRPGRDVVQGLHADHARASLAAAIDEAHKRGLKVTGHLCSVTYAEAADLGIDNLEHGFLAATDFVADKQPDVCPGQAPGQQTIAALDPNGAPFKALVKKLDRQHVALTSTLTVFETFTPGRPMPPGLDVLLPQLKRAVRADLRARAAESSSRSTRRCFRRAWRSSARSREAGGMLVAGTDPTGGRAA